jgi:Domain of unknown function DUF29
MMPGLAQRGQRSHHPMEAAGEVGLTKLSELCDRDFVMWTEQQAAALRRAKDSNLPLDWRTSPRRSRAWGRSDRHRLRSQIRRVLRHLFKLEASPAVEPRAGWRETIGDARTESGDLLRDSPSLRREVETLVAEEANSAANSAAEDMARYEARGRVAARIEKGGFSAEQVLGNWFPNSTG